MSFMDWWKKYGTAHCRAAVERAGTTWAYCLHIAHKRKRPGPDLARRMVKESGDVLSLDLLLFPLSEKTLSVPKGDKD